MKTIDIIVPFYNEEEVVIDFITALNTEVSEIMSNNNDILFNYIFVDNGSIDKTYDILSKQSKNQKNINLIKLVRNFGIDGGIRAGLNFIESDAAVILHGDLQDNPKIIRKLINHWENGFEQVVVKYGASKRENLYRKLGTYVYYKWATYASNGLIISGVSDYRLISKKIINQITKLEETIFLLRGVFIWPGYEYKLIEEKKENRKDGKSKINLPTVLKYFKLPISLSTRILYVIPIISTIVFVVSMLFVLVTFFYFVITGDLLIEIEPRLTLLIIINITLIMMIGIISAYIGIIFEEIKKRPAFIVDAKEK